MCIEHRDMICEASKGALRMIATIPSVRRALQRLYGLNTPADVMLAEIDDDAGKLVAHVLTAHGADGGQDCNACCECGPCRCPDDDEELVTLFKQALVRAQTIRGLTQRRSVRHFISDEGRKYIRTALRNIRRTSRMRP